MSRKTVIKFDLRAAKGLLPKRLSTDNKSSAGRSLIIAGSAGMFGAGVLAATAAARVGSGYVTLMTDLTKFSSHKNPDFLTRDWKQNLSEVEQSAIGIGPGLGKSIRARRLLRQLINFSARRVVVDADALNILSEQRLRGELVKLPQAWIVTPHEGELARLLKIRIAQVRAHRRAVVEQAQKKLGCVVLLKGHKTLIASAKHVYEIQSGNPALAKAGTGDVLTGMITGFLAQGLAPIDAACLASFVHGKLAEDWVSSKHDVLSLMASDLLALLPKTLHSLR